MTPPSAMKKIDRTGRQSSERESYHLDRDRQVELRGLRVSPSMDIALNRPSRLKYGGKTCVKIMSMLPTHAIALVRVH